MESLTTQAQMLYDEIIEERMALVPGSGSFDAMTLYAGRAMACQSAGEFGEAQAAWNAAMNLSATARPHEQISIRGLSNDSLEDN